MRWVRDAAQEVYGDGTANWKENCECRLRPNHADTPQPIHVHNHNHRDGHSHDGGAQQAE